MPNAVTQKFIEALGALERDGDVDGMVAVFADDAILTKLDAAQQGRGTEGARAFWQEYRKVFDDISSAFTNTVEDASSTVLEWVATGNLSGGHPIEYTGVSVLDIDGDTIRGFRTYYDSAAFLHRPAASGAEQ